MPTPNYFFNTPSSVVALETIENAHPSFSQTYRVVRNGFTGLDENGVSRTYTYYPCNIQQATSSDDLDYTLQVTFGDLGEIIPNEIDRVFKDGTGGVRPTVKYRVYLSDGVTHTLEYSGDELEIKGIACNKDGSTFEASPVTTNTTSIGVRYTVAQFEGLRGFT
jgi:hypothetical protein